MNLSLRFRTLRFALPVAIVLFLIFLAKSPLFLNNPDQLAIGITLDLVLIVPLVWWLLIRKTKIPATTVVPVAVIGSFIAAWALPAAQQGLLNNIQHIVIPLAELFVLGFVIWKVTQIRRAIKRKGGENTDMWLTLNKALQEVLPGRVGRIFASEMAVFYYGLFAWGRLSPKGASYSYHEKSANRALLLTLLLVVLIETVVLHLLLAESYPVLAWVLFGLSMYSGLMIIALARAMSKRPILIDSEAKVLYLRYSFFIEAAVDIRAIGSVEHVRGDLPEDDSILPLCVLKGMEEVNVLIRFREKQSVHMLYGIKKESTAIACWVDDHAALIAAIEELRGED